MALSAKISLLDEPLVLFLIHWVPKFVEVESLLLEICALWYDRKATIDLFWHNNLVAWCRSHWNEVSLTWCNPEEFKPWRACSIILLRQGCWQLTNTQNIIIILFDKLVSIITNPQLLNPKNRNKRCVFNLWHSVHIMSSSSVNPSCWEYILVWDCVGHLKTSHQYLSESFIQIYHFCKSNVNRCIVEP